MEHLDKQSAYIANRDAFGRVVMRQINPKTGAQKVIFDKPNLITKGGADIVANALSGRPLTAISHIYVGYNDDGSVPSVTVDDTVASFSTFARIPLAFSPGYANEAGYQNNLAYFTVYLTGTADVADGKQITSLGLISAAAVDASDDRLFSKISFNAVTYDSSFGLAITWGLTFRSQS